MELEHRLAVLEGKLMAGAAGSGNLQGELLGKAGRGSIRGTWYKRNWHCMRGGRGRAGLLNHLQHIVEHSFSYCALGVCLGCWTSINKSKEHKKFKSQPLLALALSPSCPAHTCAGVIGGGVDAGVTASSIAGRLSKLEATISQAVVKQEAMEGVSRQMEGLQVGGAERCGCCDPLVCYHSPTPLHPCLPFLSLLAGHPGQAG
jgi:hypothetical protein